MPMHQDPLLVLLCEAIQFWKQNRSSIFWIYHRVICIFKMYYMKTMMRETERHWYTFSSYLFAWAWIDQHRAPGTPFVGHGYAIRCFSMRRNYSSMPWLSRCWCSIWIGFYTPHMIMVWLLVHAKSLFVMRVPSVCDQTVVAVVIIFFFTFIWDELLFKHFRNYIS